MMVNELIDCIDRKTEEIGLKLGVDIIDKGIEIIINDYVNRARGCPA